MNAASSMKKTSQSKTTLVKTGLAKTALIMAGGTGGHIFPGLAIAQGLQDAGWRVVWLGGKGSSSAPSMESRIVPREGIPFESISFGGLRGKDWATKVSMPFSLINALVQSVMVMRKVKPDVVIGMGGYISFPAGFIAWLMGKKLVLHEQNSVAGLANKVLSKLANKVFTAFPKVLTKGVFVGNPLRQVFKEQDPPASRFANRTGPLQLLVVGGSLGAQGLNRLVPQALALIPNAQRPHVLHQSGERMLDDLRVQYMSCDVQGETVGFILEMAQAFAKADLVIARSGASTVTEVAAIGVATLFVPFPHAVDDHQTANAQYLVNAKAAWLEQQRDLTPRMLADFLLSMTREGLLARAVAAQQMAKLGATQQIVKACGELAQ